MTYHDLQLDLLSTTLLIPSPLSSRTQSPFAPLDIGAEAFAELLTLVEGDRYRKLKGHDYVCHLEGIQSNAVSSFLFENRKLSYWAQSYILSPDVQSKRAKNLRDILLVIKVS
jgi:hypothetical protein